MVIPTILARIAAGAAAATEGELAGDITESVSRLGLQYTEKEGVTFPVSSSVIRAISYKNDIITVVFLRGGSIVYDYPGTEEEFIAFMLAPSKGEFFNAHLRDR